MSNYPGVVFSVPSSGTFRVHYKVTDNNGAVLESDYTVEAQTEREAYEKVFGTGTHDHNQHEQDEYHLNDPYLAFFRET